ncbi:MAG: T9SS type A sorting domain-containing protein [Bacteroidota bacterium]|jgi:hypothetical protein
MRTKSQKLLMTFLLLIACHFYAKAQVSLYDFTQSNGTYTELIGATTLATATATTGAGSLDDINYTLAAGTIPFSFVFDGLSYTGCTVSTNGYITFGSTAPTTTSYIPISATTTYSGAVSALGGNLNAYFISGNATQTGSIRYQTIGTTPNRKFVIQYKNFKPQAQSGTTYTTAINFQIVLNETSNAIDVVYNFTSGQYTVGSYQVGLRGANNTYPTNIKNRSVVTGTNTWATSVNGTVNNSTCGISTSLLPAPGLTFRYAPTSCPSPTNLFATQITTNSATLSWTNPVTGGTFNVEYGPVGFTPGSGTIVNTSSTSVSITGLSSLTSYSFYVQKSCGTGNNSLNIGPYNFSTGGLGEDCSTAQLLSVATSLATCNYTTVSTGVSINGPTSFCSDINGNQATNDKWFKFVAPANGKKLVLTTQAGTNNDWVMEVWTSCPGGTGYQFKCADDVNGAMPEISLCQNEYTAGQTYYVRVWTYLPNATGTMNICCYETTMCAVAPSNDNCANAIRLNVNPPLSCSTNASTFLNNYATRNTDAATCDPSLLKGDVWFVFNTGNFSDVDLTINAITATNVKAQLLFECGGFEVACWNPVTNNTKTIIGLNPQADYILRVWTDSTVAGTFSICITDRCSNPTATTSGSYTTCTGTPLSIPVVFTGTPPFSLTYSNGNTSTTVTGITATNYNLIVTPSLTSTYTLTAMNDATCVGSASGSAAVTVITPQNVTLNAFSPICDNAPLQQLSGGSPLGGVYSGVGVSNGFFDPAFGSQTITYTVTYTVGCSRSASQVYTVNPLPTVTFASLSPVCNTAAPFTLTGGSPTGGNYAGTGVSNNTFNPSTAGPGTYTLIYYYTTPAGCTANDTSAITVTNCSVCTNPPTANAGTDKTICFNATASISGSIGGAATSQTWSGGTGTYAPSNTSLNITYTPSASEIAAGFARLFLTTNDPDGGGPCIAAIDTVNISIIPSLSTPAINGVSSNCTGVSGVVYSVTAQSGASYNWTVPTGVSITAGQGTNSITTTWGATAVSGNVSVTLANNCISVSSSKAVTVSTNVQLSSISGSTSICLPQSQLIYSVTNQSGVTYAWTVPSGVTILSGQGTSQIITSWSTAAISGNISVVASGTCNNASSSLPVTISSGSLTVGAITGNTGVCASTTGNIYSVSNQTGTTYTWTLPTGGTITSGQGTNSISVSWSSTVVAGTIKVVGVKACATDSSTLTTIVRTAAPTQPSVISGNATMCSIDSAFYSIIKTANADYYTWVPDTGMTINGSSVAITIPDTIVKVVFTSAFTGDTIKVRAGNCKGIGAYRVLRVTKRTSVPTAITAITGQSSGLCGVTTATYTIAAAAGATNYTWRTNITGALINGQAVSSLTVNGTILSVTITYPTAWVGTGNIFVKANNGCGSTAETSLSVSSVIPTPGTVTGSTSICPNQTGVTYSIVAQSGVNYNWTVPSGVTITSGQGTNTITTSWASTAGNVTVALTSACGTSSNSLAVSIASGNLSVGPITGNSSNCKGITGVVYSIPAIAGATYSWTVPTGVSITAGSGTNSITTTWSSTAVSGNVSVNASTTCSSGSATLPVTVTSGLTVGAISGNSPICRPATGVVYSVVAQAGVSYVWTVPTGVTITAGAGTNSITTSWSSTSVTSAIKVVGTSSCGKDSTTRTITVRTAVPTQPGTVTGAATACIGDAIKYSIAKVATADYYVWTPKTGMLVNGSATALTTTDTSVIVTFTTGFVGDTLKVYGGNCKGLSTVRTKVITRNTAAPTTPGVITGQTTGICGGGTFTYSFASAVTNATSYTWRTKKVGALLNGQAVSSLTVSAPTQSITVTYPANTTTFDSLFVKANNGCGSSAERGVKINVVPSVPSAITIPSVLCIGTTVPQVFSIAPVTSATSYTWTYPTSGTTYVSGQGTTNLTLRFTATGSKSITVKSGNACGLSTAKSVSVNPTAACPTARDGSAFDLSGIVVYPNPTRGNVTIAYTSIDNSDYTLNIFDMSGRLIETYVLNATEGYNQKELNLEGLVKGTYIVSLKGNGLVTQTRLILD